MSLNIFILFILNFFVFGCGKDMNTRSSNIDTGNITSFDPYTLTTHIKMGSCQQLPITHRMLNFLPISLENDGSDVFIGSLDLALYSESNSYEAIYRELPGVGNINQSIFELKLSGNYHFEKSSITNAPNILHLDNIGSMTPTMSSGKLKFILTLSIPINRKVTRTDIEGMTKMGSSSLFADSCPAIVL